MTMIKNGKLDRIFGINISHFKSAPKSFSIEEWESSIPALKNELLLLFERYSSDNKLKIW